MTLTAAIAVNRGFAKQRRMRRWGGGVLCVSAVLLMALALGAGAASAATPDVAWALQSLAGPTNFQATDTDDRYTLSLLNVGSVDSSGTITVIDTLPAGVTTSATPEGKPEEAGLFSGNRRGRARRVLATVS